MNLRFNRTINLMIIFLILMTCIGATSAMSIDGAKFSTGGGLEDKTYATFYVGDENAYEDVIIQIYYSRDGSYLNNGNMVSKTVDSEGYFKVASADSYKYFPDFAEVYLYDTDKDMIDQVNYTLTPNSDIQTFGLGDFDEYISSSDSSTSSSSGGDTTTYNSGTSSSYVGNSNSGKFHAPGCSDVNKMKPSNKVYFSSRDEAISSGYSPCGHCHP